MQEIQCPSGASQLVTFFAFTSSSSPAALCLRLYVRNQKLKSGLTKSHIHRRCKLARLLPSVASVLVMVFATMHCLSAQIAIAQAASRQKQIHMPSTTCFQHSCKPPSFVGLCLHQLLRTRNGSTHSVRKPFRFTSLFAATLAHARSGLFYPLLLSSKNGTPTGSRKFVTSRFFIGKKKEKAGKEKNRNQKLRTHDSVLKT